MTPPALNPTLLFTRVYKFICAINFLPSWMFCRTYINYFMILDKQLHIPYHACTVSQLWSFVSVINQILCEPHTLQRRYKSRTSYFHSWFASCQQLITLRYYIYISAQFTQRMNFLGLKQNEFNSLPLSFVIEHI